MPPARYLSPTTPGGLLSPSTGDELTPTEELTVQAIAGGTYFVENEVPSGTVNGTNKIFTLAGTPNPASSLELSLNGSQQKAGGADFTLATATVTFVIAPESGSTLLASYRIAP